MCCLLEFFPLLTNNNKMDNNQDIVVEALLEIGNQAVELFVHNADMSNESQSVKPHYWSVNSNMHPKIKK